MDKNIQSNRRGGRTKSSVKTRIMNIHTPEELFDRLERLVVKTKRSKTAEVLIALEKHINSQEQE